MLGDSIVCYNLHNPLHARRGENDDKENEVEDRIKRDELERRVAGKEEDLRPLAVAEPGREDDLLPVSSSSFYLLCSFCCLGMVVPALCLVSQALSDPFRRWLMMPLPIAFAVLPQL